MKSQAEPQSAGPEEFFAGLSAWVKEQDWPVERYRYGAEEDQFADLRLPAGADACPVALVVHGGFWSNRFSCASTTAVAIALAQAGWASWNVEYRRIGCGGGVPVTLEDVSAAARMAAATEGPWDSDSLVAIGHSSGAQLALWLAGAGLVTAAVGLAGICDLRHAAETGVADGSAATFVGGMPDERPQAYEEADPTSRLPTGVPQLLVHGEGDAHVGLEHSRRYQLAALEAGDNCELISPDGADHFNVIDPRSSVWTATQAALDGLSQLGKN